MPFLSRLFSSRPVAGSYPDEPAEVGVALTGSRQEKRRLTALVNRIARGSDFGRSLLEDAARGGYMLGFAFSVGGSGVCLADRKALTLNPILSDVSLIKVLAHEARHAGQEGRTDPKDIERLNIRSEIMYFRAAEADAEACAAAVCHEMAQSGDRAPFEALKANDEKLCRPFAEAEGSAVRPEIMTRAFDSWYENPYTKFMYAMHYHVEPMTEAMKTGNFDEQPFSVDMPPEKIIADVCAFRDGKTYFTETPSVLMDEKHLGVGQSHWERFEKYFALRSLRTGTAPDTSLAEVPVIGRNAPARENIRAPVLRQSRGGGR